jgi:hypothetical protein
VVSAVAKREIVETALGVLDLLARRKIDRRVIGDVDHVLADDDQRAADGEIIDRAAVVLGIDDGRRLRGEARQILARRHAGDVEIGWQERLERHRARDLAGSDQAGGKFVDLLVDRLEEMRRLEKIGDAIERLVVDQDSAQQRLLRFDIVRCGAEYRDVFGRGLTRGLVDSHE